MDREKSLVRLGDIQGYIKASHSKLGAEAADYLEKELEKLLTYIIDSEYLPKPEVGTSILEREYRDEIGLRK